MGFALPAPAAGLTGGHAAECLGLAGFGETIFEELNDFVTSRQEPFDLRTAQVRL